MAKKNLDLRTTLRDAKKLHLSGSNVDAKEICFKIIQQFPRQPDALYLMAQILCELNEIDGGLENIKAAFEISPNYANNKKIALNLFNKLLLSKKNHALEDASLWLIQYFPKDGIIWNYLGIAKIELGKFEEANEVLKKALLLSPKNSQILTNLGNVLIVLEKPAQAAHYLEQSLAINPHVMVGRNNLGNAYLNMGLPQKAIEQLMLAIQIDSSHAYVFNNLGLAYKNAGLYDEAIKYYRHALILQSKLFQVYPNLIEALRLNKQLEDAIVCGQFALGLAQDLPELWGAYGDALRDANHLDAAIEAYIKALSFKTDEQPSFNHLIYTSLLFCLNYHPDLSAESIFNAYRQFDERFCLPLMKQWKPHSNEKKPNKRLKIGYVSPSFYNHVCRFFLIPLLQNHDKNIVEIFAYSNVIIEDETTQFYRSIVDHWVPIVALTDLDLVEKIRSDGIDILIDVAGHTNGNRLSAFAHKPAPVSLHWLDYGYTTGLSAIDYYLTDKAGVTDDCDHLFSEKIWRLDGPAFAYRVEESEAQLNDLPFDTNKFVTFGTLSRSVRINHKVVKVWAAILEAMPNSRLMINSGDFKDPHAQEEIASRFMQYGIERSRLEICYTPPSWEALKKIDICLDCFPHNSGTTLIESIYMGVPFISLAGRPSVGRIGSSVLTGIGREEWIAHSEEEYAQKVIILAHDVEQLRHLRKTLRSEMEQSLIMNEPAFARSVEKAYRHMWQIYCEENPL